MPVASGAVLTVAEGGAGAAGRVAAPSGDCVDAQLAMTSTAAARVRVCGKVRKSLNLVLIMPSIPTSIQPRGRLLRLLRPFLGAVTGTDVRLRVSSECTAS